MDLENDRPTTNGKTNNDAGNEYNPVPSNESGEEINDGVSISKRSKKIAKMLVSSIALISFIAIFLPVLNKMVFDKKAEPSYSSMFDCSIELVFDDDMYDCFVYFEYTNRDSETEQREFDIKQIVDKPITLKIVGENDSRVLTITDKIEWGVFRERLSNIEEGKEYTFTVFIGDEKIKEEKICA